MKTEKQNALERYEELLASGGAAYDRLNRLFDPGTFVELGRFVKRSTTSFDKDPGTEFEGVVTGYGAVDGKLVFAYAQDFSRMKGAMSEAHAKKIVAVYDAALKSGAPVVGIFDSAGAKVLEGVSVLTGYGSVMNAAAKASGVVPQIAVVSGPCSGSSAVIAEIADVVIGAEDHGKLYINSPFGLSKKGSPDAGTMKEAAADGALSILKADAESAIAEAKKLLSLLPSNSVEGTAYNENGDSANRYVSADGNAQEIVAELADAGSAVELGGAYEPCVRTYIASIGGITTGVASYEAALTAKGAEKAAKFVSFCDAFSVPVVTLVDCDGPAYSSESESAPLASKMAKLASVYALSTTPKVTVITGKAYGSAFTILGSKTLGADVVYALPCSRISIMAPEAAVEFLYADRIKAASDPLAEKDAVSAEWEEVCAPVNAARSGDIDDVIDQTELRMRVAASLEMLSGKATLAPYKKHGNLPL